VAASPAVTRSTRRDKALRVAISVRTGPADRATETGRTDLMEAKAISGNFGPGTAGMTLHADQPCW
jgi:hypothetical protein